MTQTFSRAISRMSRWILLAAVLTGLAGASVVDAATADPLSADEAKARDEALEFFKAGRNAFKAGDYDAARELFQKAWARYDKEPLIALALAKAYDRAGLLEKAQIYYEHFLRLAPPTKEYLNDREQAVQRLAVIKEQLKSRPGILKFKGLPTGARLEIDSKPADVDAAGELKVIAGNHSVRVTMDRRLPFERPVVAVGPGEVKDIEVVLVAPVDPSTLPRDHKWTWVAGGATAVGLIATGVVGFMYWQEYDAWATRFDSKTGQPTLSTQGEYSSTVNGAKVTCSLGFLPTGNAGIDPCAGAVAEGTSRNSTIKHWQIGTAVAGGVTALAAIGTVVAFYTAPTVDPGAKHSTSWMIVPQLAPGISGAQFALRF
jgi:hypothetical protein